MARAGGRITIVGKGAPPRKSGRDRHSSRSGGRRFAIVFEYAPPGFIPEELFLRLLFLPRPTPPIGQRVSIDAPRHFLRKSPGDRVAAKIKLSSESLVMP